MQTNDLTRSRLRRLAETRPDRGLVWSLYLNLDPTDFGTAQARSTAIRSLLDEAERVARDIDGGLDHDARVTLKSDLERVRQFFSGDGFSAEGAHGLAIFCAAGADLFEALKLPRPVQSEVVADRSPHIAPLADMLSGGAWCVLLVSRQVGRILRGDAESLTEVARVVDEVHGQHDQGGWSQARYQRSVEKEAKDHLGRTADAVFRSFRRRPFDCLLIGATEELCSSVGERLHPWLRQRLVGRFDVDVEHTNPDQVRLAARPKLEQEDRRRERAALDRLAEAQGAGRAALTLADVLEALTERRVEVLLLEQGFNAAGTVCPRCGWMGEPTQRCPVDGGPVDERSDVTEDAVEAAVTQSAEVMGVRHHDDLEARGGIAAILRF